MTTIQFPNEKPFKKAQCRCGGTLFEFLMSHTDEYRVALIQCANCGDVISPLPDDEPDFEIFCEVDP